MKKFAIVLKFELKGYFGNKTFMMLTIFLALLGTVALFLPRLIDMSGVTGVKVAGVAKEESGGPDETARGTLLYMDEAGVVDEDLLRQMFEGYVWRRAESLQELQDAVRTQEAEAGFWVKSADEYVYYVFNKSMHDRNTVMFNEVMRQLYRETYCAENNLSLQEIAQMYNVPVTVTEQILNKDSGSNYWYCYVLVILVFMLIVYYGQMIAVSVTNEKSNRAIEVLVTSTTSNSLLFGKVIAGAISGVFQMGVCLGAILLAYRANRQQWGGMLDMFLNIPGEVLLAFLFFGLGGYLFYAFLYGAMGALVSKTEDVSKSVSGLMAVIMIVYFFSLMQLTNIDGPIIKVLSFLPFSSYSTMFARIGMGTVAVWEIAVSFLILAVSIVGTGVLGAKLYRMGTLRYGNPIKFSTALRDLKKNKI